MSLLYRLTWPKCNDDENQKKGYFNFDGGVTGFCLPGTMATASRVAEDRHQFHRDISAAIIIIIMAGMAVVLRGWLPHRGEAQMAYNWPIPRHVCYSLDSIFCKQLRKLSILNDIHILVYYLQ